MFASKLLRNGFEWFRSEHCATNACTFGYEEEENANEDDAVYDSCPIFSRYFKNALSDSYKISNIGRTFVLFSIKEPEESATLVCYKYNFLIISH